MMPYKPSAFSALNPGMEGMTGDPAEALYQQIQRSIDPTSYFNLGAAAPLMLGGVRPRPQAGPGMDEIREPLVEMLRRARRAMQMQQSERQPEQQKSLAQLADEGAITRPWPGIKNPMNANQEIITPRSYVNPTTVELPGAITTEEIANVLRALGGSYTGIQR